MKNNLTQYNIYTNSRNTWQYKLLRNTFGWAGLAKFGALCDMMADSNNCVLSLNGKHGMYPVAAELDFSLAEMEEFIYHLLHICKLIIAKDGGYTTVGLQKALVLANKTRAYDRLRKQRKLQKTMPVAVKVDKPVVDIGVSSWENAFSTPENEHSTVQNSIVQNSTEKNRKEEGERADHRPIQASPPPTPVCLVDKNFLLGRDTFSLTNSIFQNNQPKAWVAMAMVCPEELKTGVFVWKTAFLIPEIEQSKVKQTKVNKSELNETKLKKTKGEGERAAHRPLQASPSLTPVCFINKNFLKGNNVITLTNWFSSNNTLRGPQPAAAQVRHIAVRNKHGPGFAA